VESLSCVEREPLADGMQVVASMWLTFTATDAAASMVAST